MRVSIQSRIQFSKVARKTATSLTILLTVVITPTGLWQSGVNATSERNVKDTLIRQHLEEEEP